MASRNIVIGLDSTCVILTCIFLVVSATADCQIGVSPVINTAKGQVQGSMSCTENNAPYFSYKGIPYAKAPVGRNRFKPPLDVEPWTHVLNASVEGNSCPQFHFIYNYYLGNEDCLYLNVFTPKRSENLPVMVWIHGGNFENGSGNESIYGPDYFVEKDIVVVTINYRLGALGFLALRHSDATGNAGLKDQNAALKWVRLNIANFGGDPKKVTIFGQSVGSVSTQLHLLSPMSDGLFRSVISSSGTPLNHFGMYCLSEAEKRAFKLGSLLGCEAKNTSELLDCLYDVAPHDLVNVADNVTTFDTPFKATVEDVKLAPADQIFLSECPIKIYKSGKFRKLPQIIGYTKDENLIRFTKYPGLASSIAQMIDIPISIVNDVGELITLIDFNNTTSSLLSGHHANSNNGTRMNVLSDLVRSLRKTLDSNLLTIIDAFSEILFVGAIDTVQELLGENYYYIMTFEPFNAPHRTVHNIQLQGSSHCDDTEYVFHVDKDYYRYKPQYTTGLDDEIDYVPIFKRKMAELWTNFVIYNDPTPFGENDTSLNFTWLPAKRSRLQLDLNTDLTMKPRQLGIFAQITKIAIQYLQDEISGCETDLCTIIHLP